MRAIFLIAGPGIQKGVTIPEVENVDVYPLMTELLGLKPATGIDGRAGRIGALIRRVMSVHGRSTCRNDSARLARTTKVETDRTEFPLRSLRISVVVPPLRPFLPRDAS